MRLCSPAVLISNAKWGGHAPSELAWKKPLLSSKTAQNNRKKSIKRIHLHASKIQIKINKVLINYKSQKGGRYVVNTV